MQEEARGSVKGGRSTYINAHVLPEGKVITSLYLLSQRQIDYKPIFTEPEATDCFSINFQVFTNNNQHNFKKNTLKFITVQKDKKQKAIVSGH